MRHKTRAHSALATLIVTASSLIASCYASQLATEALGEAPQNISKRERELVRIIEEHSLSFAIEKFVKDPVLVQTQMYTRYLNPKAKTEATKIVLNKKNEDTGKDSIVLSSANNRFAIPTPRGAKKRQFVLLRRAANQGSDLEEVNYYSSLIYVRNLYPNDTNKQTFNVDGVDSVVEFDIWEQRPRKFFAGWTNCDFSTLFTCTSMHDIAADANHAVASKRRKRNAFLPPTGADFGEPHWLMKRSDAPPAPPPKLTPIVSEPGCEPANYNDLYLDFDFHRFDVLFKAEAVKKVKKLGRRRRSVHENELKRTKRFVGGGKGKGGGNGNGNGKGKGKGNGRGAGVAGLGGIFGGGISASAGITGAISGGIGAGIGGAIGGVVGGAAGVAAGAAGAVAAAGAGAIGAAANVGLGVAGAAAAGIAGGIEAAANIAGSIDMNSMVGGGFGFGSAEGGLSGAFDIAGSLGGILEGGISAVADIGGSLAGSLTGGGNISAGGDLLGGLLGGGSGDLIGSLMGAATGDLTASLTAGLQGAVGAGLQIGGGLGGLLTGALEAGVGVVGGASAGIEGGLSAMLGMGGQMVASMQGLANGIGIGGMLDSVGFSGLADIATGIADSIIQTGENFVSTWETFGHQVIEAGTNALIALGVPPQIAKLAALGGQLALNSFSAVFGQGFWGGWRLGIDFAGMFLNGGRWGGKGFDGDDSMPSNNDSIYGVLHAGAEDGKYFFFPEGSLVRAVAKVEGGADIAGWFEAKMSGDDAFYPDDDAAFESVMGSPVKLLPTDYEVSDPESHPGVDGELQEGYMFVIEGKKITGCYQPGDEEWEANVWMPPGFDKLDRPETTPDGKKIYYGYLFNGIEDSPHIFVAEGDTLTGVFVPADAEHSELSETPHGVLTPNRPAGHAIYVADDPREVINIREIRGVFLPDKMDLAGGISGKLSKLEDSKCDIKFSFHLDRPATDYVYIHGESNEKNIWSPYIKPSDWQYKPANSTAEDETEDAAAKKQEDKKPEGESEPEEEEDEEDEVPDAPIDVPKPDPSTAPSEKPAEQKIKQDVPGAKVKSKHTLAFIPEDFEMEGGLIAVDSKTKKQYPPMVVKVTMTKPDDPWTLTVTKKPDAAEPLPAAVIGLFVPLKYVKQDAIIGKLEMEGDQTNGKLTVKGVMPIEPHLWTLKDEIWTPAGFLEKMQAEAEDPAKADEAEAEAKAKAEDVEQKKKEKLEKKQKKKKDAPAPKTGGRSKPKSKNTASADPPRKTRNTLQGRLWFSIGGAMRDDNTDGDEYVHGVYLKSPDSPEPIFVPDTGILGMFVPDGGEEHEGYYFPKKGEVESAFVLQTAGSVPGGTAGKFYTLDSKDKRSEGFLVGTLNGDKIDADDVEEIPGWEVDDQEPVTADELPAEGQGKVAEEHFKPTKIGGKYATVDIGGGFDGIIIDGPQSLDDPNIPIFQEYLHYRSTRDGDVNPWGKVGIVDPVKREPDWVQDGKPGRVSGSGLTAEFMVGFSFKGWIFPVAAEISAGFSIGPNKIGNRVNLVNMMDFRMFLMNKYTCKRADLGGEMMTILTPKEADGYVNLVRRAKPKDEWLQAITSAGLTIVNPDEEGAVGKFSAHFGIAAEDVSSYEEPGGSKDSAANDNADWKKIPPFDKLGDEHSCDEISLDDFQASEALSSREEAEKEPNSNGISLGFQLVHGRGNRVSYAKIAAKLSTNYDRKVAQSAKKKKTAKDDAGGTTDLMGEASAQAEVHAEAEAKASFGGQGRTFGNEETEPDTREHAKSVPGWKTQYRTMVDNITLSEDGILFYGLGNCDFDDVPDIELLKSKKMDKVIKYYMQVLRVNCMPHAETRVKDMINQGFLKLAPEGTYFVVPEDNKMMLSQRLTPAEMKKISQAYELHAVTRIYARMLLEDGASTSGIREEPHCIISRSVGAITELTFYTIDHARRITPTHGVRMNRNMLATLRTVMTKLHQDWIKLQECGGCEVDKNLTAGDKFRIMSLINFIIYGLLPYHKGEKSVRDTFTEFVNLNKDALHERVQEFERQFPHKVKTNRR